MDTERALPRTKIETFSCLLAWSYDRILPCLLSTKCIPPKPKKLADREAGDTISEKGFFVVKSLWVGTSAKMAT